VQLQCNQIKLERAGWPAGHGIVLTLETGSNAVQEARFHMETTQGLTRTRAFRRNPAAPPSGRFFMPLTGHDGPLTRAEIELDAPVGVQARITACRMEAQP